jgi:predicted MFS family arabinose efflux permease
MVRSRAYILFILVLLSAFNQLDRHLMAILLPLIGPEFALSDVEIGLLSGLAFALLFGVFTIPASIWAVRFNRRNIVAVSAAFWGAMTLLTGFAQSFWHLLVTRIGLGIGEASSIPASHGMISELYRPNERATALSIWSSGFNIGLFAAFLIGGLIGQAYGWRIAFLGAGIATIVTAFLLLITTRDPSLEQDTHKKGSLLESGPLLRTAVRNIWSAPASRNVVFGATLIAIMGNGALAWVPTFLVRSHGMSISAVGLYLSLVAGIGGAIGVYLVGRSADYFRERDQRWSLWVVALVLFLVAPLSIGFYLSAKTNLALAFFVLPCALGNSFFGPSVASLHNHAPSHLRPPLSALFVLVINVVGMGIGPLLVGSLSQWVFAGAGVHSLAYALALTQILTLWGALLFFFAGRELVPSSEASRAH